MAIGTEAASTPPRVAIVAGILAVVVVVGFAVAAGILTGDSTDPKPVQRITSDGDPPVGLNS